VDYQSCLEGGSTALHSSQWDSALAEFQRASSLDPSKSDPWAALGTVYMATGQYQNAAAMWDKVLGLGGTLAFDVWHYKPSHCEQGTFYLGAKEVSFVVPGGEKVFSVAPTEVSSVKSHHPPLARDAWSFGMKAADHYYWFSSVPSGVQCASPIKCSDPSGYSQEEAVSNYVAQTIAKLAPGSGGK
jgi:tetratricopeptide (TPR) repeat protein